MQQPIFFENEIVGASNLTFLTSSTAQNIKNIMVALTAGTPGIVGGLNLQGVSGNNYFTVATGFGFTGDGERVQVYSGTNVSIAFTGTSNVYLNYGSVVYNPDPTQNPQGAANVNTNTDPTDNNQIAVENYNFPVITFTSGANYIPLGTVSADSNMHFLSASTSGAQALIIGGILNINENTLGGVNIATGTINSNAFTNPLTYSFALAPGLNITLTGSGSNNIGSISNPLANVYAVTGNFHSLVGFSPIITDTLQQKTGTSLESTGNNFVQIDTELHGTRFGNELTIIGSNISTVGLGESISINTDPTQVLNINTTTNVPNLFVGQNLTVTGTTNFVGPTNINNITGNLAVAGSLTANTFSQQFSNLAPNNDFSLNISGNNAPGSPPLDWNFTANNIYAYGPVPNSQWWLTVGSATLTALNNLTPTGNYTVEANIKILGPSYFGSGNAIWQTWLQEPPNGQFSTSLYVTSSGNLGYTSSYNANIPDLLSPTGLITTNQWYDVAVTWNGTHRNLYLNNTLVATDTHPGGIQGVSASSNSAIGEGFNGLISNFRISNVALTAFPSGSAAPTGLNNSVLAWYTLNNTLSDLSSLNSSLVTYGFPGGVPFTDTGLGESIVPSTMLASSDTLPVGSSNSLYGSPNTNTWLFLSGNNISSAGELMYAPVNLKSNTTYNVSYYTKGITGCNNLGIVSQLSGTSSLGNPIFSTVTNPNSISNPTWQRYSTTLTTPVSGSNFNLMLTFQNLSSGTINPVLGIAAVQVTEGPAAVPYNEQFNVMPTYAYLAEHGTIPSYKAPAGVWTVLSGNTFNTLANNFVVNGANPHKITYVGSTPIIADITASANMYLTTAGNWAIGIQKNGNPNSIVAYSSSSMNGSWSDSQTVSQIMPMVSGDYVQLVGQNSNANGTTATVDMPFQIKVTKVV